MVSMGSHAVNELTAGQGQGLTAILICPDEELAAAFLQTAQPLAEISVVGRLADYPSGQVLEERVVSLQPDVVLLDVGSSREESQRLVSHIVDYWPQISAVGLSHSNEPDVILGCLRSGASEFLSSPFPASDVQQARCDANAATQERRDASRLRPARGISIGFCPSQGRRRLHHPGQQHRLSHPQGGPSAGVARRFRSGFRADFLSVSHQPSLQRHRRRKTLRAVGRGALVIPGVSAKRP